MRRRVLAIPRAIDAKPVNGVEIFGSLAGNVPNDGAWHALVLPAGVPPLQVDPTYRIRIAYVRAEWQLLDLTVPPPLTLSVMVNGAISIPLATLAALPLLAVAQGTPAIESRLLVELAPGSTLSAAVRNTGAVTQDVDVFFSGWAFPQTTVDGAGYAGVARPA